MNLETTYEAKATSQTGIFCQVYSENKFIILWFLLMRNLFVILKHRNNSLPMQIARFSCGQLA
ncbi:hypothetical protein YC2023_010810 [Brassica napus]